MARFALAASFVLVALAARAAPAQEPLEDRPNVIVFLVDDLGWQDTSVPFWTEPTPGNRRYATPNLERLAAHGVRFANAYACSVCSPSRTSLMTGWNAARHGVTNWTFYPDRDQSGTTKRLRSPADWNNRGLQPASTLLPERLRAVGYATIHAGKAHWGALGTAGADPTNLGFDVNIAGHHAGGPGGYHGRTNYSAVWRGGGARWDVPGLDRYHGLPIHLTDATTVEALRAVDAALDRGAPFYLYLAHYAVHAPIEAHEPWVQRYLDAGLDEREARYASMVEGVDRSLGAVLAHLRRRGVDERTLVVFTSDNGGLSAHARGEAPGGGGVDTHNAPLRAGKASAYEGGTRVPWVVSWATPNAESTLQARVPVEAGVRRTTPILIEDLYPTVLAWAGAPPDDTVCDGRDLTSLLAAPGAGARSDRALVFHYPHKWGPNRPASGYEPHSALRLGGHKVVWFYERRVWELYDLVEDVGEVHDLATSRPELLARLAGRLVEELDARGARYPVRRDDGGVERPVLP